ncbi:hypothetical protein [Amycolatopsis sp. NPDC051903]|uniref:hypothetical protein n=1 Tax=Amycolatopsis sp. NPDC051903 TaxID=3363936 RepID=UPI0037B8E37F
MLSTSRGSAPRDLLEYGEDAVAVWVMSCSDDDFLKVCAIADWLLLNGPTSPSGASMVIAKGIAAAAVCVHDGAPREPVRKRRWKVPEPSPEERADPAFARSPDLKEQWAKGQYYGVTDAVKAFWGSESRTT